MENVKTVVKRNLFVQKYKHLRTTTTIRAADPHDDYIYEDAFRDRAFVAEWKFTPDSCERAGCFPLYTPARTCQPDTPPKRVHPSITACGPACYAVSGAMNPFYSRWAGTKCITMDAAAIAFFIDPALRADPTGRDSYTMTVRFPPNETREFVATVDAGYCDQFGMVYDTAMGSCETTNSTAGAVVSFFTGESLIKMFRLSTDGAEEFFASLISRSDLTHRLAGADTTDTGTSAAAAREQWLRTQPGAAATTNDVIATPVSLSALGLNAPGDVWTDTGGGGVTNRGSSKRSKRSTSSENVRSFVDKVADDLIKNPQNTVGGIVGGVVTDHAVTRAKKYIVQLKKTLLINTSAMTDIERRVASTVVRRMTIDRVAVETGKMIALSARLSTAALSTVGIVSVIGPILDLFWATCWDPLNMTFRPMSNADAKRFIQTAAVEKWKTEPIEFLPEYAWDNYYADESADSVVYAELTRAVIEYVKHRTTTAMGSNLVTYDQQILNYDTMPGLCMKLRELRNIAVTACAASVLLTVAIEKLFIVYIVGLCVTAVLSLKIYNAVHDYNVNLIGNYMDNVEFII